MAHWLPALGPVKQQVPRVAYNQPLQGHVAYFQRHRASFVSASPVFLHVPRHSRYYVLLL